MVCPAMRFCLCGVKASKHIDMFKFKQLYTNSMSLTVCHQHSRKIPLILRIKDIRIKVFRSEETQTCGVPCFHLLLVW